MFRLKHLDIDTLQEHVVFIHEDAVKAGNLGFRPLDRVRVVEANPVNSPPREVTGVLNFCRNSLVARDEIGVSDVAARDLGLADGARVQATLSPAPPSVDRVRAKLEGQRLDRAAFDAILRDVTQHRYSKVELSMFVLACALRSLDNDELVAYTQAMIATGTKLSLGASVIADKHCVGGVPGNRTTMIVVPILAALGVVVPKTSSRAITSPAGTADTMGVLAEVALGPDRLVEVIRDAGACIAWGGSLDLAPADDILITVERPMEVDTEAQMVASILAKKKSVGATHVLIDIPVGPSAKVRSAAAAERLEGLFRVVAREIELHLDVIATEARGPIGLGIGPRLEALDVLAVLRREAQAATDLREKSLYLAARLLEMTGVAPPAGGYRTAQQALDSGAAERAFERIISAQGERPIPPEAPYRRTVVAPADGHIRHIDCWHMARIAKCAGAPAHAAAGVRMLRSVGDVVARGEPIFEIHAQSPGQLEFAASYAARQEPHLFQFGF